MRFAVWLALIMKAWGIVPAYSENMKRPSDVNEY